MRRGAPGKIRMGEIARLARVSESTVSRALAGNSQIPEATRQRVAAIAAKHGYRLNSVARSLRTGETRVIGVTVPLSHSDTQHLTDPFFMSILSHVADQLAVLGYDTLLRRTSASDPFSIKDALEPYRTDGLIVIGQSFNHKTLNAAAEAGARLVVWGAQLRGQKYISVGTNNRQGGSLATEHLLARGRKDIVFMGDSALPEVKHRHEGYLRALTEAGRPAPDELCIPVGFTADEACAATRVLLERGVKFDAIVAASDVIALGAIRVLQSSGKSVPKDVAVVGYDDIMISSLASPPLTTIRQDIRLAAQLLVERLLSIIKGTPLGSIEIPAILVERASS
ncbi:MAG: LacI family DNA-binding transcriptional regulator [Steroidobacteraceae bacterium]